MKTETEETTTRETETKETMTMKSADRKMLRIGVFYDGGFFHHISNYYRYAHPRKQRISIPGLHAFIRQRAAEFEGVPARTSHIVDAHFFRGRFSAQQTLAREKLYSERLFDDVLMNEGITSHHLPIQGNSEQGIDVWLSLEALELAMIKHFDVLVLIAGDSDFVPLVRKINALGTRVMLLGWNFEYTDDVGNQRQTTTSIRLINEVSYPVLMQDLMSETGGALEQLFVEQGPAPLRDEPGGDAEAPSVAAAPRPQAGPATGTQLKGIICSVKEGFGFIKCPEFPNNIFFHFSAVKNGEFGDLVEGDIVQFAVEQREKGPVAQDVETIGDV